MPGAGGGARPPAAIGALVVDGVSVDQPGRDLVAPAGASLVVRPGEIVAVTGPSGAGKSTLLAVVLGLLEPSSGRVAVRAADGVETDVRDLDADAWRARVAWVPQVPFLFAGSVAENVRLATPSASDEEVRAALVSVGLGDLPPDRVLGERGRGLSSGQRRRVGLARALVRRAPVLLLDEPTAGLDEVAEAVVLAARARARPAAAPPSSWSPTGRGPWRRRTGRWRCAGRRRVTPLDAGLAARLRGRRRDRPRGRGVSAILSILRIGRPVRRRLILAVLAGAAAGGAAIGLAATSAWLISRAAEQPVMLTLLAAITAVRAFGISRGVFRYLERVAAHDAAFRVLGELRGTVYARLATLAPAGLAELRSGDLLARLVGDVDGLADLWLRVLLPYASATVVAVGTVAFVAWMVPAAGLVLAASLLVTAIVAPFVAGGVSRRAEARLAPGRGELADAALDLLRGAPEIMVAGAAPRAIGEVRRVDARLAAAERRSAVGAGVSGLVASLCGGRVGVGRPGPRDRRGA